MVGIVGVGVEGFLLDMRGGGDGERCCWIFVWVCFFLMIRWWRMNVRVMNSKRVRMMFRIRVVIWVGVRVGCWGVRGVLGFVVGVGERDIVFIFVGFIMEVVVVFDDGKVVMVVVVVILVKDVKVVGVGEEGVVEFRVGELVGSGFVGFVGFVVFVEFVGVREVVDLELVDEEGVGFIGDWFIGIVVFGMVVVFEDKGLKMVVVMKIVVVVLGVVSVVEKMILVSVFVVILGIKIVVLIMIVEVSVVFCCFLIVVLIFIYFLFGIGVVWGFGLLVGVRIGGV